MAGDWIKFETATSDKPEVWAMAQSLGIDADAVVGKLLRVWAWFDQQTQEGNAVGNGASVTSSVTKALLDRRVGVSGFCDSMILSGWMADDGQSLTLPNFDRHNGKTAKTRAMTAKRVATHKAKGNGASVTSSVSGALPREEKRREELVKTPLIPQGGEVAGPLKGEQKPKATEPPQDEKPKRKPKETVGEFLVPQRLDSPEIREALEAFERMRVDIGHRIKDRSRLCLGWDKSYRDKTHLLDCIQFATANEYQGIKPRYIEPERSPATGKPIKRESDLPKVDSNWEPA
jgi:hypothetical protein